MLVFNCQEVTRLAEKADDKQLTLWQRAGVKLHLIQCVLCRRYFRQRRLINAWLQAKLKKDAEGMHMPDKLHTELDQLIQNDLRKDL